MTFKQGDLILIPFPFTDLTTLKQRPAVIISSEFFNQRSRDVIVAAVTSRVPKQITKIDYVLSTDDLESSGLPKTSLVKIGKIVTIDQRLIRKRLGSLPSATLRDILSRIKDDIL